MVLRATFLACLLLALAGPSGIRAHAETSGLTDSDQDQIAEALLVYSQSHPATYLGANAITVGYLMIRGDDPSPNLMEVLQKDGFAFKLVSGFKQGDGYVISIGTFQPASPTTATGALFASCGGSCGAFESYIVKKVRKHWTVDSFQLLAMS